MSGIDSESKRPLEIQILVFSKSMNMHEDSTKVSIGTWWNSFAFHFQDKVGNLLLLLGKIT